MATDIATLGLGTDNPFLGIENPYLRQMIDAASGDVVRNFNLTARPASNAAMVRSGSFGNSGLEEMARNDERNLQGALGDISTKLRFQDYGQQQGMYQFQKQFDEGTRQFNEGTRRWDLGFDRDVFNDSYAQNMGNLQAGIGLLGTLGGYNALDLQNATTEQDAPLSYLQRFGNLAQGLGGMGGSTSQPGGGSSPLLGAIGGAQLGNSWWNSSSSNRPSGGGGGGGGGNSWWDSSGSGSGWV